MNNIQWTNLKAHFGSQDLAFDSLSKLLLKREYKNKGKYRPVGGIGQAQGGVEAVIELTNGKEVGIQAKWFPTGTLSSRDSNRRKQIEDSLKLTVKERPNLIKWILSVSQNFSDGEKTWWENLKTSYPNIELEKWEGDFLYDLLVKPENFGLITWFFGDLEFNHEWFKKGT